MIDILSSKEVREITGTSRKAQQIEWLEARGWPHEVNHFGLPVVLRSVALDRLGGEPEPETWTLDPANVA